jgi:hypothetical protein
MPTAIVELEKPRRGKRHRHMDVPLTSLPGSLSDGLPVWLGQAPTGTVTAKDQLHTPFGVYLLLAELTEPARRITRSDRLFVSWACRGYRVGRGFRIGLLPQMVPKWGRSIGLLADPRVGTGPNADMGAEPDRQPLEVTMPRLRLTSLAWQQKAVAHTDQVLASEYLGRDRGNLAGYQRLVAAVLDEQVAKAHASVPLATLTEADVAQAQRDPAAVASRFAVDVPTLKRILAGELDTVLAACVDHTNSPYAPPGSRAERRFCAAWTAPAPVAARSIFQSRC